MRQQTKRCCCSPDHGHVGRQVRREGRRQTEGKRPEHPGHPTSYNKTNSHISATAQILLFFTEVQFILELSQTSVMIRWARSYLKYQ